MEGGRDGVVGPFVNGQQCDFGGSMGPTADQSIGSITSSARQGERGERGRGQDGSVIAVNRPEKQTACPL